MTLHPPSIPPRRRFIVGGAAALCGAGGLGGCASTSAPVARPVPRASSAVDAADLALLNRVTWGIDSAALAAFNRGSRLDYLRAQLEPGPVTRLPATVQAQVDSLGVHQKSMPDLVLELEAQRKASDAVVDVDAKKAAQQAYQQALTRAARDAAATSLWHALYSPQQLQSQLTWFWFNHFNVHQYKANLRVMLADYESRLRGLALGRFRDLLVASATHVAMIRYLDNEQNAARHVNENFAREVMELHTLGVDGGYSQRDVQELARVLTGMGINFGPSLTNLRPAWQSQYVHRDGMEFNPARHDSDDKSVLGVRVSGAGWREILDQLNRLAQHPATARHVCQRLAMFMAADQPPPALVERMVRAFHASDGSIGITLRAMFEAPEFAPTLGRKFKDPMHFVVSAVRLAYDGRAVLNTGPMQGWLNRMGQGLYNRQTPDGYPMDAAAWTSSGQMDTRFEIARTIGGGPAGLFRGEAQNATDTPAFPQLSNALFHSHLASTFSPRTRAALDGATSPQEWNALLLSSPEFNLR